MTMTNVLHAVDSDPQKKLFQLVVIDSIETTLFAHLNRINQLLLIVITGLTIDHHLTV